MTTTLDVAPPGWSRYFAPSRPQLALGLACRGLGCRSGRIPQVLSRTLPCAALVYVRSGSGWLSFACSGDLYRVDAMTAMYLPAGASHSYGPGPDGWDEAWVLLDGPAVTAYEELGYLAPRSRPRMPAAPLAVELAFSELRNIAETHRASVEVELVPQLHAFITALGSPAHGSVDTDTAVLARLRQLALQPVRIETIATEIGISLYELRRIVRAQAGCSVKEYVDKTRIDTAQLFLVNSRASVRHVAAETGYSDPAYFSRAFFRHVGMSPRAFRQAFSIGRAHG